MSNAWERKPFFVVGAESLSRDLKADGTVPLTANWAMGAFELSQATWKGVAVGVGYGGTGLASYAIGDILHATGTTTIGKLADVAIGQVLTSGGVGAISAWSASPTLTGTLTANNITGSPTLGNEINTGFSSWTAAAGWAYTTKWTHSAGTTALTDDQSAVFSTAKTYKIIITYSWAGGGSSFQVAAGGQSWAAITSAAASTVTYYLYPSATTRLTITPTNGFTGSIDSVSIMETTNGAIDNGAFTLGAGNVLALSGNAAHPTYSFAKAPTTGMYFEPTSLAFAISGTRRMQLEAGTITYNLANFALNGGNTYLIAGTAELQLGQDAASPTDQTLKAHDASGNDGIGAMLTLQGGQNKGSGAGGGVRVQTANVGASASTAGVEYTRYRAVGKIVTLTDAAATDVVSFAVTAGNCVGGMLVYTVTVYDNDASDNQIESGTVLFAGLQDEANWHTNISEVSTQALESGSLATTWAIDTATANTLKITCLADSDLTAPVITLRYQLFLNSPIVETV